MTRPHPSVEVERQSLTSSHHQQRQNISRHEHPGQPPGTDETSILRADALRDPGKRHVDARGEKGGREQEQQALHDVRPDCPVVPLLAGYCAPDVTDEFN